MSSIQRDDTTNQRDLFDDDVGKMTVTSGASRNVTPEALSVCRDEVRTTDDELEVLDPNPPMGQPSDVDGIDNSSVESPFDFKLNFNSKFVTSFRKIDSPTLGSGFFSPSTETPSINQSSGSSESTVVDTDNCSDEAETKTSVSGGIPYRYLEDDDASSTTSEYWDEIETAGLKRKAGDLVSTPRKSMAEIFDDAMVSSAEHNRQVNQMKHYLDHSTPHANKKLRCHLLNEINKFATGSGGSSSTEDEESSDDDDRKETPEERNQRLRDDDDDEQDE
jgi:hypothetical protein